MKNIAIVVVAYNRSDTVSRLLNSLDNAYYPYDATLIISIDKSKTQSVAELSDEFIWRHGQKIVVKHPYNLGLRNHILSVGKYTEQYDAVIVLEDDLIVSPNFFNYSLAMIEKYGNCDDIAGISLFLFSNNYQNNQPFRPLYNGYDVFLMNCAMSWGQIWIHKQWSDFIDWYKDNSDEFGDLSHLPLNICRWPKTSWLKYHTRYCIEKNKYFVYPYVSLDTNSGSAGTHSKNVNNIPQVPFMIGMINEWRLPEIESAMKYDGFFENKLLKDHLSITDICVDLNGSKKNRENNRYWLTSIIAPYYIEKSYGLSMYPIEMNVLNNVEGTGLFLYDTHRYSPKVRSNLYQIIDYNYKLRGLFSFVKHNGLLKTIKSFFMSLLRK